jgi:hypothetical protein
MVYGWTMLKAKHGVPKLEKKLKKIVKDFGFNFIILWFKTLKNKKF